MKAKGVGVNTAAMSVCLFVCVSQVWLMLGCSMTEVRLCVCVCVGLCRVFLCVCAAPPTQ